MHGEDDKFFPAGWCTDMASGNFIGLVTIYGEDILETVKGCEFHFRDQSTEERSYLVNIRKNMSLRLYPFWQSLHQKPVMLLNIGLNSY